MATLYDIESEQLRIFNELTENGGELTEELEAALRLNAENFEAKAEGYIKAIRNNLSDAEAYKAEMERLAAKKKTAENTAKYLKERLQEGMQIMGEEKRKVGTFSLRLSTSKAVEVTDMEALDEKYLVFAEPKVNKTAIKDAIKAGEEVKGAMLVENVSVVIR